MAADGRGIPRPMRKDQYARVEPWMLFVFPAAIAVPIVAGFLVGGPLLGLPLAAVIAVVIAFVAVRKQPSDWRSRAAREEARLSGPSALPPAQPAPSDDWRAAAARRFLAPLVIAAAGVVVVIAGHQGTLSIIGWGVIGVAVTVALSLMFLEVGYSEDRARAREQRLTGASRGTREHRFSR